MREVLRLMPFASLLSWGRRPKEREEGRHGALGDFHRSRIESFELHVFKFDCLSLFSLEMTWLFVFYRGIEQVWASGGTNPPFFCQNKSPVCSQGSGAGEKWCHEAWEGWGSSASHIKGLVSCCRRLQRERPKKGADWSLKLQHEGDTPMWKIWDVDIIDVG